MDEVAVDHAQVVAAIHGVEELLAHAHQRRRAAGREIEPAQEFQPARLGGAMQFGCGLRRLIDAPGRNRFVDARAIMAERGRHRLEESDARSDRQVGIFVEDLVGERHARGLPATRQQFLAELDEAGGALVRRLAALAQDQGAAAVRDALQHFAEKRGVHRNSKALGGSELMIAPKDDKPAKRGPVDKSRRLGHSEPLCHRAPL